MPLNNSVSPHCPCENGAGGCSRSSMPGHSFPVSLLTLVCPPHPIRSYSVFPSVRNTNAESFNVQYRAWPGTPFLLLGLAASNLFQSSIQYKFTDHQPAYSVQHCQRDGSTMWTEQVGQCSQTFSVAVSTSHTSFILHHQDFCPQR